MKRTCCALLLGVAAVLQGGALGAETEGTLREAETPPWLEPLRDREGRVSWRAITIGMQKRSIASLLRVQLRTDMVMEVGCGGDALEIVVDGVKVLMGFEGAGRDARLHTLFVYVDPPIDANEAVGALRGRLPDLTASSSIASDLNESGDTRPAYRIGDPEIAVIVDPRGIWLSHPTCVE